MNATQLDERRFDRGAWLTLAAVLLFALAVFGSTFAVLAMPGDGWQMVYPEPPLVTFLGDWPTPLQAGDIVLAVDGISFELDVFAPITPPEGWQAGMAMPYRIERDGRVQTVEVLLGKLTTRQMLHAVGNALRDDLPQWSWFVVGVLVFFLRPGNPAARLLFLAGSSFALATKVGWAATTVSASFAPPLVWYTQALTGTFWGWLFFPALILLLLSFPQPLWPLTAHRRVTLGLLILLPLGMTLLTFSMRAAQPVTILLIAEAALIFLAAVAAVVQVFRRGDNREARAQVGWLALGMAVTIGGTLTAYLLGYTGLVDTSGDFWLWPLSLALPVCLAIAILRYRLFDIDVIVRKTAVYAILTALLALVYFGSVLLLQNVFGAVAGEQPTAVIVISTLLIAALFAPLRRRVQDTLDRRFFRQKYDAQQALARFAATARDETDRQTLTAVLVGVIQETVQPEGVVLWLNQSEQEA